MLGDRKFYRARGEDLLAMQELLNVIYFLLADHPEIELTSEHRERLLTVQRVLAGEEERG